MNRILIPAACPDDWKGLLSEPRKQWKSGYSARALAYCWQEAGGIPEDVAYVLTKERELEGIETLCAFPEHQVPIPGGKRPSQNDVWVLARANGGLVSIAVEGKINEPFGPTIGEWKRDFSPGKKERYKFLCSLLGFDTQPGDDIRYQLLHRTASAIIEAKRFYARYAVMVVHSFSQSEEWFTDYERFLSLFGVKAELNTVIGVGEHSEVLLYFAWIRGDKRYLSA